MTNLSLRCLTYVLASVAMLSGAVGKGLADDPRIDAATGRDLSNYPHPRHFDLIHMKLGIDIPDMSKPFFDGMETLTATPIGKARSAMTLDCNGPKVESVTLSGRGGATPRALAFVQGDGLLTITFNQPVNLGETVQLVMRYSVDSPKPDGTGLPRSASSGS